MRARLKKIVVAAASMLAVAALGAQPALAAAAELQGIDVSSWQPSDVTRRVTADFAIVKATQGTGFVNGKMTAQADGALATGKKLGFYHYAGGSSCVAEADFFVRTVRPWVKRAVLVLDWESYQNVAWGSGSWSTCFVKRVQATTGVMPMVYVQASALSQVAGARQAGAGLWAAQYASNAATGYQSSPWLLGRYGEAMRQYTSNGWLSGYAGPLDLNIFRGSREQWDRYANPGQQPTAQPTTPSTPQTPSQPQTSRVCVTVQPGDSLSAIAARSGSVWSDWTGYHSGNPALIYAGETVCRSGGTVSTHVSKPSTQTAATVIHVVVSGETLSGIGARYGVSWQQIAQINGLRNANLIFPGQRLTIRRGTTVSSSGNSTSASGRVVIVRSGDTLSCIAARYNTSWQHLAAKNGLRNANLIYPGQRIVI